MEFVSAINHGHNDIRGVSDFLCDHFEFTMIYHDSTSATVNNGVLSLRFYYHEDIHPICRLDLETTDLDLSAKKLKSIGFTPAGEVSHADMFRQEQPFSGPFGLFVNLHKVLSEDDLGIHPELETTLDWDPEAEEMAKSLLAHVTIHFRNPARKKMVQQAEALALIEGNLQVTTNDMVTSFLYTTPYFKQDDLQKLLLEHGISQEFITTQINNM